MIYIVVFLYLYSVLYALFSMAPSREVKGLMNSVLSLSSNMKSNRNLIDGFRFQKNYFAPNLLSNLGEKIRRINCNLNNIEGRYRLTELNAFAVSMLITLVVFILNRSESSNFDLQTIYSIFTCFGLIFLYNFPTIERKISSLYQVNDGSASQYIDSNVENSAIGNRTIFYIFISVTLIIPAASWIINDLSIFLYRDIFDFSGTTNDIHNEPVSTINVSGLLEFMVMSALIFAPTLFFMTIVDLRTASNRLLHNVDSLGVSSLARIKILLSLSVAVISALIIRGTDFSAFSLFSGLVAAGLSVALRETIGNFIAGIQMSWDKSLKIGDVISIPQSISDDTGSTYGIVRDIKSRYTVIEDRNTVRRLVPNSLVVSESIEHWTHQDESVRLSLNISIPYIKEVSKIREAKQIMEDVCYDVPRVLIHKAPTALLVSFGESALSFSLRFWIDDAHAGIRPVISEVLISLYERLGEAGIEIPFPQQDIHLKDIPPITFGEIGPIELLSKKQHMHRGARRSSK